MSKPLVSMIVPNYNCEEFLERCILSIIKQTYENLEIIIVDDGSKDGSRSIIEKLKKQDNRIISLYKENGGASSARNAGIEIAKGKYFCFIDSDDYIVNDYVEKLYYLIEKYNVLISLIGIKDDLKKFEEVYLTKLEARKYYFEDRYFGESPCEKLIHRSIFNNLRFKEGYTYEDTFISYRMLEQCDNTAYINYHGYIGNYRDGSSTRQIYGDSFYDKVIASKEIYDYYKDTECKELAYKKYIGSLLYFILKTDETSEKNSVAIEELKELIKENGFSNLKPIFIPFIILLKLGLLNKIKLK